MKKLTLFILCIITMLNPSFSQSKFGLFDHHTDIGNCKNKGFASYNSTDQTYTIGGSGVNMWFGEDEFHYLWTTLKGDFILRAEARFLGAGVDPHRKLGWIVKNNLANNSHHVNVSVHGDGLTSLQYRKSIGGDTEEVTSKDSLPDVIQLERIGDSFFMSTARFGEEFITVKLDSMNLDDEVYVGLYVCSHNPEIMETAVFRNVRIIRPADADFEPYQDYIGSNMEVMDINSGHRKVLFSNVHSIQAPNWTPDGKSLIYNSKGHLYKYQFETEGTSLINTGFANKNNNDHALTQDGKTLGISHHDPDDDDNSTIYYLSSSGDANPVLVTKPGVGDSYFHGWSPDGQKMVFTGHRKEQFDIYQVDKSTGKEAQLTDLKTLDDGPEYSPDGKQIFFNSVRTGKMKLWKMDADGKNQIQITHDEYNDWFPHISPDQKWILFISFPKDIDPTDHPFYKHCLLRIMPYEGGKPRIIGYLYGGQGTINVPSWSPDSQHIAFVTNTKL